MPQPLADHDFADKRETYCIENFLDLGSNLAVARAGAVGLVLVRALRPRTGFAGAAERWPDLACAKPQTCAAGPNGHVDWTRQVTEDYLALPMQPRGHAAQGAPASILMGDWCAAAEAMSENQACEELTDANGQGFAVPRNGAQERDKTCAESVRAARQVNTLTMAASARMQRLQRLQRLQLLQPFDSVGASMRRQGFASPGCPNGASRP